MAKECIVVLRDETSWKTLGIIYDDGEATTLETPDYNMLQSLVALGHMKNALGIWLMRNHEFFLNHCEKISGKRISSVNFRVFAGLARSDCHVEKDSDGNLQCWSINIDLET